MKSEINHDADSKKLSTSLSSAVIALVFITIGYQAALFVNHSRMLKLASKLNATDTVYVIDSATASSLLFMGKVGNSSMSNSFVDDGRPQPFHSDSGKIVFRKHPKSSDTLLQLLPKEFRPCETFPFNPNEVTHDELVRLGFSQAQATSIIKYRDSGGKFRRKADFAKSFVVADSVYQRLKDHIIIPLVDINAADTALLDDLPGIGKYLASKIIHERQLLGGFSSKEQLLYIYGLDKNNYDKFSDLITLSDNNSTPYRLWTLPADSLRLHPYIRSWKTAKAIVLYRDNVDKRQLTLNDMLEAGVLNKEQYDKLSLCRIALP